MKLPDKVEIHLDVHSGKVLPDLKLSVNGEIIYDDAPSMAITLKHEIQLSTRLQIKIEKSGKTKAVADSNEPQEVHVNKVLLNGLDQHADKFGIFDQKNNSYVEDQSLDGNIMSLNGDWTLDVPILRQPFLPDLDRPFRDEFTDAGTACFGCSFTYGSYVEYNQSWPYFLGSHARNYGIPGSSISSIVGTARHYIEKHSCERMIILLPHSCRLQLEDQGTTYTLLPGRTPKVEKKFKQISKDIVMFGEGSLLLSGYAGAMKDALQDISQKTKLFLSSYNKEIYDLLPDLDNGHFTILPFYELSNKFELASDNEHPGPEHNRAFADKIRSIIG
jgi:hypothetical protein